MAQYDITLIQNTHATQIEFSEKIINISKGGLLSADTNKTPTVLAAGTNGYMLVRDDAETTGLKWIAIGTGHTQNTDTGTTGSTFDIDSDGTTAGVRLKANVGVLELRNLADDAYADLVVKDLTVQGTTTTVNSTTLKVVDKNIELGTTGTPTDVTADGGGITLKGATDKTLIWDNANDNWTSNQDFNLLTGKSYKINNTVVLSATQVLGKTLGTMAEAATTDYVTKALFDANTILFATTDNTPAALTVAEQTLVGRKTGGAIASLTPAEIMNIIWVAAPANRTAAGTAGQMAKDANFIYFCETTGAAGAGLWTRTTKATNW
jgi:hypothetical protein